MKPMHICDRQIAGQNTLIYNGPAEVKRTVEYFRLKNEYDTPNWQRLQQLCRKIIMTGEDHTRQFLDIFNRSEYQKLGFHVHKAESEADFTEPFGAILYHRRRSTGYPLCGAAALCGLSAEDLLRIELGWMVPEEEELKKILAVLCLFYGLDPIQYFALVKKGNEYRAEEPADLSTMLGLTLNEAQLELMPESISGRKKPSHYERMNIRVVSRPRESGMEFPQEIIWTDGRSFPIERIDRAQNRARFATGGVGTRFSCWIRGQQRYIGYETPGEWFVESPCTA